MSISSISALHFLSSDSEILFLGYSLVSATTQTSLTPLTPLFCTSRQWVIQSSSVMRMEFSAPSLLCLILINPLVVFVCLFFFTTKNPQSQYCFLTVFYYPFFDSFSFPSPCLSTDDTPFEVRQPELDVGFVLFLAMWSKHWLISVRHNKFQQVNLHKATSRRKVLKYNFKVLKTKDFFPSCSEYVRGRVPPPPPPSISEVWERLPV